VALFGIWVGFFEIWTEDKFGDAGGTLVGVVRGCCAVGLRRIGSELGPLKS
jgi:hypothetical protein